MKRLLGAIIMLMLIGCGADDVLAQTQAIEYEVNAGFNIGGATPLPLPAEIRKIESYNPRLNLTVGAKAKKMLDAKWGVGTALRLEMKGMSTSASVKNYGMEIIQDDSHVRGRWTGKVNTTYHTLQLAVPLTVAYRFSSRWQVEFGPYAAVALSSEFKGYVHDGYLREGDPTGEKVVFEGDTFADYDFSDNLRRFQLGLLLSARWMASDHVGVNAALEWGCSDVFKKSFTTVTFDMYPVFFNLGVSYRF